MPVQRNLPTITVLAVFATVLTAAVTGGAIADQTSLRLAMHDMMPMQQQLQSGRSGGSMGGGMMNDNTSRMQQPAQSGQPSGGTRSDNDMRLDPQGSGQMGGMMNDGMMRMMNEHMNMMRGGMRGDVPGMARGPAMVDMTERLDGRLAFLRAELKITDAQAPAWNAFADALQTTRKHLLEARQQLNQMYSTSTDHLEKYEQHLAARLEALKLARSAFARLHASLDDIQKRTADELVAHFIATF